MSDSEAVETTEATDEIAAQEDALSLRVIALAPDQMADARVKIMDWCKAKISRLVGDQAEAKANYDVAIKNKWRSTPFKNQERKLSKLVSYYEKILAAIGEGYLIVPSFPIDVFAIRTNKTFPRGDDTYRWSTTSFTQTAQTLPIGEGKYVSNECTIRSGSETYKDDKGEYKTRTRYVADEFMEVEFPVSLVKPEVIERTANAIKEKIFDEVGLVQNTGRADPIVIGRINNPVNPYKSVSFFLAWWLNAEDL